MLDSTLEDGDSEAINVGSKHIKKLKGIVFIILPVPNKLDGFCGR